MIIFPLKTSFLNIIKKRAKESHRRERGEVEEGEDKKKEEEEKERKKKREKKKENPRWGYFSRVTMFR
jgi:hypothetical protein